MVRYLITHANSNNSLTAHEIIFYLVYSLNHVVSPTRFSGHGREQLIRFLVSLQSNYVDGVRIVLGRAQVFFVIPVFFKCGFYYLITWNISPPPLELRCDRMYRSPWLLSRLGGSIGGLRGFKTTLRWTLFPFSHGSTKATWWWWLRRPYTRASCHCYHWGLRQACQWICKIFICCIVYQSHVLTSGSVVFCLSTKQNREKTAPEVMKK